MKKIIFVVDVTFKGFGSCPLRIDKQDTNSREKKENEQLVVKKQLEPKQI